MRVPIGDAPIQFQVRLNEWRVQGHIIAGMVLKVMDA